ncbi:katanin p80 WD40 repeat-containing subunit B1 homolog KTN80.4-like isoform X1 [Zingiber officinale]|uniref:katanin p80 WD40 repeat-containing subunit B1 homolog KTN80.4-like isoform X1 n=1 Tax=Zingiber officinale TaxID=94328 RepID=UPI001C4DC96E|nr:katanin p80 WD40 repeat-containing subunit B1 homolog KTN80.4-like isoform X1 [Zingiber officinale]
MATAKRAYKLQEFVAHSSNVNCLKIGRKTSRVLVTGGEDHKVNLWAIGKPNAILSLAGHMSAVESVSFDLSEVLVAAGAASGSIKLWDLEEAKIVRTLTGHRSNCIAVDFHPFGEFFASGSLDTNLKIWDIRRKGCIHTYKGHTRGVNAIKFTPDGRWVVSGGEDNTVKLWDLTAGKLLHDFKFHEGQIQCIDFHPNEFLLATGSADRTVKFWDLETFELIGSAGPETSGVRSMIFNPDGRTLLCGLHESLKVFSWEPIRCHDAVDVGWSRLSDMNIHEGKLLGCSYNQSCVGVWVVDLSLIEPYAIGVAANLNGEAKSILSGNLSMQTDSNIKSNMGKLSISQSSEPNPKETKLPPSSTGILSTPQKVGTSGAPKTTATAPSAVASITAKRSSTKSNVATSLQAINKTNIIPVIVPRSSPRPDLSSDSASSDSAKETDVGRTIQSDIQSKFSSFRNAPNIREDSDKADVSKSGFVASRNTEQHELLGQNAISSGISITQALTVAGANNLDDVRHVATARARTNLFRETVSNYDQETYNIRVQKPMEASSFVVPKGGRTRSLVANFERRDQSRAQSPSYGPSLSSSPETGVGAISNSLSQNQYTEEETLSASDENSIAFLLKKHHQFLNLARTRLTKLQVVHRLWRRNDVKGVIGAIERMSDHSVSADIVSALKDKSDVITLDICTSLLPHLTSLIESKMDRHLSVSLEMLLKLIRIFGPVIRSTLSADPSSVGVDLQAEQRLERCNLCFIELEKVQQKIPSMTRKGGSIAKTAQELNLALQEVL